MSTAEDRDPYARVSLALDSLDVLTYATEPALDEFRLVEVRRARRAANLGFRAGGAALAFPPGTIVPLQDGVEVVEVAGGLAPQLADGRRPADALVVLVVPEP